MEGVIHMPDTVLEEIRRMSESQIRLEARIDGFIQKNAVEMQGLKNEFKADLLSMDKRVSIIEEDKRKINSTLWSELLKVAILAIAFYFGMTK